MPQPRLRPVPGEPRTYAIVGTGFKVRYETGNYVGQSYSWVLLDENEREVRRDFTRAAVVFHYFESVAKEA